MGTGKHNRSLCDLVDGCHTHARADAHGDDASAAAASLQFVAQRRRLPGPGAPKRVP